MRLCCVAASTGDTGVRHMQQCRSEQHVGPVNVYMSLMCASPQTRTRPWLRPGSEPPREPLFRGMSSRLAQPASLFLDTSLPFDATLRNFDTATSLILSCQCCWMVVRVSCLQSSFWSETPISLFKISCIEGVMSVSRSVKLKVMLPKLWLATHRDTGEDVNRWPYSANQAGNFMVWSGFYVLRFTSWMRCGVSETSISVSTTPGRFRSSLASSPEDFLAERTVAHMCSKCGQKRRPLQATP